MWAMRKTSLPKTSKFILIRHIDISINGPDKHVKNVSVDGFCINTVTKFKSQL